MKNTKESMRNSMHFSQMLQVRSQTNTKETAGHYQSNKDNFLLLTSNSLLLLLSPLSDLNWIFKERIDRTK